MTKQIRNKPPVIWGPHEGSQTLLLGCPVWECLLHGNRGGGKTDVLIMDFLQGIGQGYGIDYRGLLLREATTELGDVISKCRKWIPRIFPTAKYNGSKKIWTFEDGETLWLNYARVEDDYEQYHGHEYPWIGWEELTNHPFPTVYLKLMSCNRSSNPDIPKKYRATCNPSGPGHCVPYGDVLTPNGWIDIKTMKVGDPVYTVDKDRKLILSTVDQVHSEYYSGDMIDVSKRGLNMEFTPKHKLPKVGGIVGDRNREFTLLPFEELPNDTHIYRSVKWEGIDLPNFKPRTYETRKRKLKQPSKLSIEHFAELMGWFLSEGHTVDRDKAFSISQMKTDQRQQIEYLLDKCEFVHNWSNTGVTVYAPDYWNYLRKFGKCRDKYIPKKLKQAKPEILRLLFTSLMDGDGSWSTRNKSGIYYTTSKKLAEDVEEIAIKLGFLVHTHTRERKNRKGLSYSINFKTTNYGYSTLKTGNHRYKKHQNSFKTNCKRVPYNGTVHCIGVADTHTFIIKQKGSIWISGNSWVKKRFIDVVKPCEILKEDIEVEFPNKNGDLVKEIFTVTRTHIQSFASENDALQNADPMYMAKIHALTQDNEMLRKAWIDGSWDLIIGGFFTDVWNPDIHVIDDFIPPESWSILRSFDWGSSKPWGVTYGMECNGEQPENFPFHIPKGSVIIIDEIYGWTGEPNVGDEALSSEIAERTVYRDKALFLELDIKVRNGPADTSIYDVRDGKSIGGNLASHGCHWTRAYKGSGSRIAGWALIRQMLGSAKRKDPEKPHLYFWNRAENHIRTIPMMQRDKRKPEDIDTDLEDHLMDSLRYLLNRKMSKMKRRKVRM